MEVSQVGKERELARRERHRRSTYCCCGKPLVLDWTYVLAGKEGPARLFLSSPLAAALVEAWLEGLLLNLNVSKMIGPHVQCVIVIFI